MKVNIVYIIVTLLHPLIVKSQPGSVDYSFRTDFDCNRNTLQSAFMSPISVQSDGKIITGGSCRISFIIGGTQDNLFRLNTDGSLDRTFIVGRGSRDEINDISVLSNDKILISGSWRGLILNGIVYPGTLLLNSDGSVDSTFHKSMFQHIDRVYSIATINDNIAVYGKVGIDPVLLRLKMDGSLDTLFKKSIIYPVQYSERDIFYLSDGRLLHLRLDSSGQRYLNMLKQDGSKDFSFTKDKTIEINSINQIKEQHDGRLILCGEFLTWHDSTFKSVIRLTMDGSLDRTFNIPYQLWNRNPVRSVLIQRDNKILLGGFFMGVGGTNITSLIRLHQDGSIDKSFIIEEAFNSSNTVSQIIGDFNDRVLISGGFDSYGSFLTSRIARINIGDQSENLTIYVTPNPNSGVFKVDANKTITLIVINDFLGREIYRFVPDDPNIEINISDRSNGAYFLSVFANGQKIVKKIMKL